MMPRTSAVGRGLISRPDVERKVVMPEKVVTHKALCCVVRNRRLLVFRHTNYSPGGWLVRADVTETPPRIFRATEDGSWLVRAVMRGVYRPIAGIEGAGTWTADNAGLLVGKGMAQVCVHASTETWTGGDPMPAGRRRGRPPPSRPDHTRRRPRPVRRTHGRPKHAPASYERTAVHARKATL